jgi:hypothetical protein
MSNLNFRSHVRAHCCGLCAHICSLLYTLRIGYAHTFCKEALIRTRLIRAVLQYIGFMLVMKVISAKACAQLTLVRALTGPGIQVSNKLLDRCLQAGDSEPERQGSETAGPEIPEIEIFRYQNIPIFRAMKNAYCLLT